MNKYEKAIQMLKTVHKCPSMIAEECKIDSSILKDTTDDCYYDEYTGSCDSCRKNALEFMLEQIKE